MTTSGVAIGRKISRLEAPRPRNECRTRAKAIRVPSTVASIVAVKLIARLSRTESHRPAGSQMLVQLLQVNDSNWAVADRPLGWLNESGDDVADRHEHVDQDAACRSAARRGRRTSGRTNDGAPRARARGRLLGGTGREVGHQTGPPSRRGGRRRAPSQDHRHQDERQARGQRVVVLGRGTPTGSGCRSCTASGCPSSSALM